MVAQIRSLEEQETRLQEWLECLQRLGDIAAAWNLEPFETVPEEPLEEVSIMEAQEAVETRPEEVRPETVEDPFDQLRRKLEGK
jgi:hypothetical protein